ncbi:exported hypothetical protein [Microbacterium sp. 8M]|nr:exported hypothetical protein [Microbacterium sp. 8M]
MRSRLRSRCPLRLAPHRLSARRASRDRPLVPDAEANILARRCRCEDSAGDSSPLAPRPGSGRFRTEAALHRGSLRL